MTKTEFRKIYLEMRKSLTAAEIMEKSSRIADRFFETFDSDTASTVHCFIPIRKFNEIDTSLIYMRLWTDFPTVRTVAPAVIFDTGELESIKFDAKTKFVENDWGIFEVSVGEPVKPANIDLIIVPLLCFDKSGHRVGYGKGFYDRFLSKCRPDSLKVGLSYFPPVDQIEDVDIHDIKLDRIITPECIVNTVHREI